MANDAPLRIAASLALLLLALAPAGASDTEAPSLSEAFSCERPGSAGRLGAGSSLTRLEVDTAIYPDAVCNDGTAAVFYVRKHRTAESRDRWHLHLQGGGSCKDGTSCVQRWCSAGTNFGADKMSSSYAPHPGTREPGILRSGPDNPLWDWNHVLLYYCSSDGWMGRRDEVTLVAEGAVGQKVQYRISFHGADILDAVVDLLRRERGPLSYTDSNGDTQTLPDLDEAEQVLLAGSSAGSTGVVFNADRLSTFLAARNDRCRGPDCPLDFRALIDSGFKPDLAPMGYESTSFCLEAGLCTYEAFQRDAWESVVLELRNASDTEDSCTAWHETHDPGTEWRCSDGDHVVENHLSTPFFVRQDLQDNLHTQNLIGAGFTVDQRPLDPSAYGRLLEDRLRELQSAVADGEEAGSDESPPPPPAVFAPQCTKHSTLRDEAAYFGHRAPAADGSSYTTPEVLARWLGDEAPVAVVPFRFPGALPSCKPSRLGGFEADVTWTDFEGTVGLGEPVAETSPTSGLFWFFGPENWELLVKVLDGCDVNGHFWVFGAGTTNVGYQLRITDPRDSSQRLYSNPPGAPARALTDTTAFRCSPDAEGEFTRGVGAGKRETAVLEATLGMARALDLQVTAEGVETIEQIRFLSERGCDRVQGFALCEPLPESELLRFLK